MYRRKSLIQTISELPIGFNSILFVFFFLAPKILNAYLIQVPNPLFENFNEKIFYWLSPLIGVFILVVVLFQLAANNKRKKLFKYQNSITDLYQINWSDFEYLVTETFHRDGYYVKQSGGAKADGGIDLMAHKDGFRHIVQCKQWKSQSVGVSLVREMYAVCIHEKADSVFIVTCGYFTKEARDFAKGKPIVLINGQELVKWVNRLKENN